MEQVKLKINKELTVKPKRAIIIGWNSIAFQIYEKLKKNYNIEILGLVGVNLKSENLHGHHIPPKLGDIKNIDKIINNFKINHAVIALDPRDHSQMHKVIQVCLAHNLEYDIVSETYDVIYGRVIESIFQEVYHPGPITFRRIFDIFSSFFLLLLFLPLWIIIAILIKINSPGTVLYSQERVGLKGRKFRIFKFRTMIQNAEKITGPVLAGKKDSRITQVGSILRKTRLDEIPQLLNVLIGDMSMIGPRPERPYFVEKYISEIPMYKNRLKAKPGITGYAQVNLGYDTGIQDVKEKLKYDLYYINNASSFKLNLKIFIKTFWVIITGKGQ